MTRTLRRALMPVCGLLLVGAAVIGLVSFVALLAYISDGRPGARIWLDYGLVGLSLVCVLIAGVSLVWSWFTDRERDVIPGPTLYLLGLFLVMIGVQVMLLGEPLIGLFGLAIGAAIMFAAYRSDTL